DQAVKPVLAEYQIPGTVIGITFAGQRYFYHYGVRSKATGEAVDANTLFEIGSISKTITATLANYANAEGKLNLTEPVSHYVPQLTGSSFDKINLLHLATHTAGDLPLQVPDTVTNYQELMTFFNTWQPSFAAGTHRNYANPSIGLLGVIAAQRLWQSFQTAAEGLIFGPLGMTNSYIKVPEHKMADYAQGYNQQDLPVRVNPGVLADEAYGVKTSATDILQFIEANMQLHALPAPLQQALDETHVGYFDVGVMTQAMIWEQYPYPIALAKLLAGHTEQMVFQSNPVTALVNPANNAPLTTNLKVNPRANSAVAEQWINKTGSTGGFAAYVAYIPTKKLGIVILSNKNYPVPPRVTMGYQILTGIEALAK
ncbi:MAG: class C beta-lactamase, partial [Shewanella sp.]